MPPTPAGVCVGIGLRAPHYAQLLERRPALDFLEVHGENFFADGGRASAWLERFRAAYPLSVHGVGLSLGSVDPLDRDHLARLEAMVRRFDPLLVSEHLCWSSFGGRHANDLLPLPHSREALDHVVPRIAAVQERLRRPILVENIAAYVEPAGEMPEWEFLAEVARRSGCGILLDVNNVWVNATNHGFDPREYIQAIPASLVGQYHLGGFEATPAALVDTHGARVSAEVWELFEASVAHLGTKPTLIEWDTSLPGLDVLLDEAQRARAIATGARRAARQVA
jgi:uncharacterized protein (UPF0276 family)